MGLFVAAIVRDIRLPLWTDELLTLYVTQQPAISDVFGAILENADSQPPLYGLIVRLLGPLIESDALRVRLPSTIGFFLMCVCVFAFARKRLPSVYALLAMLAAAQTTWRYAYEGRSYGLTLGCVSLALLCWQITTETNPPRAARVGLALSLAAAIAFHYFAVFVVAALAAGEVIRWRNSRRPDLPVFVSLTLPLLALVPHIPLVKAASPFAWNFWGKIQLRDLFRLYDPLYWSMVPVLFLAAVCWFWLMARGGRMRQKADRTMPPHEWTASLALVLLPEFVILGSLATIRVFEYRYVLWSMIGVGIFLAFALYRVFGGSRGAAFIVTLPLVAWAAMMIQGSANVPQTSRWAGSLPGELAKLPADAGPVVVGSPHVFMELSHYSQPVLRQRLVYIVSQELEQHYSETDTNWRIFSALRRRTSLRVADYDAFVAANQRFIFAGYSEEWIAQHLHRLNYRFVRLNDEALPPLFEVDAP